MSVTANEKFGTAAYKKAEERANTPEGEKELLGSKDQFLLTLKRFADVIDDLPPDITIRSLYLTINYLGSVLIGTVEYHKKKNES